MNPLEQFLHKIQTFIKASSGAKEPLIKAVEAKAGITLSEKDITIRENIAYIQGSSLLKNELFIRKQAILQELALAGSMIRDIR